MAEAPENIIGRLIKAKARLIAIFISAFNPKTCQKYFFPAMTPSLMPRGAFPPLIISELLLTKAVCDTIISQIKKIDKAATTSSTINRVIADPGLVLNISTRLEKVSQWNIPVSAKRENPGIKDWVVSPEKPLVIISYSPPPPRRVANKPKNQRYLWRQLIETASFRMFRYWNI